MGVLSNLEPNEVFYYFEELSKIPRATFNRDGVSNFCVEFAKAHNLEYIQDETKNVVIKKPGTAGYENSEPVIIQGHLDMVAVKTQESTHDFEKDPLDLFVEDGKVGARDTSLGGDNGIAIAFAMAVLASTDLPHPPIEALFTTDEEIGMYGAKGIDMSIFKGKKCLNLDSEIEGVLTVGCAGGYVYDIDIPVSYTEETGTRISIALSGLQGGHSGAEIQKQRGNAHKLMGRILCALSETFDFNIVSTNGGLAANVIAQFNTTEIIAETSQAECLVQTVAELAETIKAEFLGVEEGMSVETTIVGEETVCAFDAASTMRVIHYLYGAPDGVQCYDRSFPGAVETSLNTGIVKTGEHAVSVRFQIRSSMKTKLEHMKKLMSMWCEMVDGTAEITGEYPAWAFDAASTFRPLCISLYTDLFGEKPTVETTHGGLECGILYDKKPDLDIVSFGPNLYDVHSVNERIDIASTARSWEYLKAILKACK